MRTDEMVKLPAFEAAALVNERLAECGCVVVTAPPGAGKSTVLPLTILESIPSGKILMLEPRRLAARQVAERMAYLMGEDVGQTIGYRIRFESKVSDRTRIEVLTEGILERMLVDDPTMDGISAIIFDEFHERSLTSELSLALARECREVLRPDLKLVMMSATIDAEGICNELSAPLVESEGRMFPVAISHETPEATPENVAETVAHMIRRSHKEEEGDILAFLPGEADIRRCESLLGTALGKTAICPLYGNLPPAEQRKALAPSGPGERKVVLATPIAETSLTIEGVRIVIDSGLHRKMVHDSQNALDRLQTVRISMDMATQRSGRAGRVAAGSCHRLWSLATEANMAACRVPEILEADLSGLYLSVAAWGESDPGRLPWLTPPPPAKLAHAKQLLKLLGALDDKGRISAHGRRLAALPCHPRIAQMLTGADSQQKKALAADIAAILEEKDPLSLDQAGTSLYARVAELRHARRNGITRIWNRISRIAEQYRYLVRADEDNSDPDPFMTGRLVSLAYPERIAKEMPGSCGRYMLSSGETVALDLNDEMGAHPWLVVASLNARPGSDGRVFLAAPLDPSELIEQAVAFENVSWDSRKGCAVAQKELRIGRLVLDSVPVDGARDRIVEAICEACRKEGTAMLDFSEDVGKLQRRVAAVASWHPELELPDISTESVLGKASEWLPPYIGKASSKAELKKIDLVQALWGMLSYEQQRDVERLAPSHIEVPTGSRIRVEYRLGAEAPVLRVRLQECFGMLETPRVDGGRRPVLMELLSPGFKPVQLTQDLHSFWGGTYFEVRKELKRRYPKHSWPDNPLEAEAVRGVGRKRQ